MIVGHEPNLSNLLALLLTGATDGVTIDMKKGGCAALELTALTPRGGATLLWLLPPRVLRRVRR
jgi:phosphohistidine phosphatase SixA